MRHSREDLIKLAQAIDKQLNRSAQLAVLDMPVLSLVCYPSATVSPPVDQETPEELQAIHGNASARARIQIPLVAMSFNDFPFMFETRLTPLEVPGTRFLKLQLINRHDAVIHHVIRGNRRELSAIESMGRGAGLSFESLLDSYCTIDLDNHDPRRMRQQLLNLVEMIFGAASVAQAEAILTERSSS